MSKVRGAIQADPNGVGETMTPGMLTSAAPLHWAITHGNHEMLSLLLQHESTDPNIKATKGITPLLIASEFGKSDMVSDLLRKGATPDIPMDSGETPLYMAALKGHEDIVRQLLARGANPERQCFLPGSLQYAFGLLGRTPVEAAIKNGHSEIVKILRANGI